MLAEIVLSALVTTSSISASFLPFDDNHFNASVGGYVVFNCHLDFPFGIEIPYRIEWYKEDYQIFSWNSMTEPWEAEYADNYGGRIQHLRNHELGLGQGSINLTSIRETDNGVYHCLVVFPNRTPNTRNNGTYYFLEVDGGNLIVTPPMNVTCMEGQRAEFECAPKSPESIVKWYKDGEAISDLIDLAFRSVFASNGSLILEHTTMTDPGQYECRVVNDAGEVQSTSAFLNVQYKAKVVYAPKERFLAYGKPASLDCYYQANPPLTNLRWEKDGFLFDPYNVPGVFYGKNGSLLFNKADETHQGFYSCIPYNKLGTEGPSSKTHVIVQRPPTFTLRPNQVYLTKLGSSVTLACGASDSSDGAPPVITWSRKDGVHLPDGRYSLQDGNITIEGIAEADRGVYVCKASNEADTVATETELVIENVARRAAHNITATATKNSIHVQWIPGYSRERIEYNVWYRPVDVSEWRTMKIHSGAAEAAVSGLQAGLEYEIRIMSQDPQGDGLFSAPVFVRTIDDNLIESGALPSYMSTGPPSNLAASVVAEGLLLTWSPPEFGKEYLQRYIVRWYTDPKEHHQGSHDTTDTYFLMREVREDERYAFVVSSLGAGDSQSASRRLVVEVPAPGSQRLVAAVAGSVLASLAVVAAVLLYVGKDRICSLKNRLTETKCNGG